MIEEKERESMSHVHPADQSRVAVRDAVRALEKEIREIGEQIKDCELAAARERDEARVIELLAERDRLERRQDALPFLLRGTKARALDSQAASLRDEAATIKTTLDEAEAAVTQATARIAALKRESEQASADLARDTKRHDELIKMFEDLERSASYAEGDARLIEQGQPMQFEPNRFDEPE
jgi:predicted  nucleic acid-binding Zn-ribbon protein